MSYKPERALTRLIPVCYWGAMNFRRNELQAREGIDTHIRRQQLPFLMY